LAANIHHNAFVNPIELFEMFKTRFDISYSSPAEETLRFAIFIENVAIAERMNRDHVHHGGQRVFGITKFMDLTRAEFKARYLNSAPLPNPRPVAPSRGMPKKSYAIPPSFDWSSKGVITPVKNQEQCGSCWAFSATETIESYWALAGNPLVELSPQQIVDCDTSDYGCNGGWPYNAYAYIINTGGQELDSSYPYTAVDGTCVFNSAEVVAKISAWNWVNQDPSTENTTMLDWVANNGPVSVCVDASTWQYYTGGVLRTCTNQIDHCVQVTGYQTMTGIDVWNVRNSWGAWGDNLSGYIYIERGLDLCLIATYVTAVTAA